MLALEDAFLVDIDPPLALRLAGVGRGVRGSRPQLWLRLLLVEVPIQSRPQHHGYLPRGTRRRAELTRGGIGDGRYV